MGLVVGSEWRAALWRSCRAAQSPMRARGMSTCLGPYRGFWVLDSGAFHRQVCGQTGVTGRKADVQLAAWTARQAGRKRLPSGLLPRVWQPRRSPAAPLGRAQHPSVHSASTPPPPRSYPAASPRPRSPVARRPGVPPRWLPPREWTWAATRRMDRPLPARAGGGSRPCPPQACTHKYTSASTRRRLQACTAMVAGGGVRRAHVQGWRQEPRDHRHDRQGLQP